jgi:protein SCO1/2
MKRSQILLVLILAIVASIGGALLSRALLGGQSPVATTAGTVIEPARAIPPFALLRADGGAFTPESLRGRWTVLFFGYTSCPDVCPTTLSMLTQVDKSLVDLAPQARPQFVFVSIDSKRDTPEQLHKYVSYFDPAFIAVTGQQTALESFATSLGAPVALTPQPDGGYSVDHSAALFVVNPNGAVRAIFSPPHAATTIAADYRALVHSG